MFNLTHHLLFPPHFPSLVKFPIFYSRLSSSMTKKLNTLKPARMLVLDLDETLGSHHILFDIYSFLANNKEISSKLNGELILKTLIPKFNQLGIFRPYLEEFLKKANELRSQNKIDFITAYTNQLDIRLTKNAANNTWTDNNNYTWSVTDMIERMYTMMTDIPNNRLYFDILLTRPLNTKGNIVKKTNVTDYPSKDIRRIYTESFKLPADSPIIADTDHILFVDDLAMHPYLLNTTISPITRTENGIHNNAIIAPQYKRKFPANTFREIIIDILKMNDITPTPYFLTIVNQANAQWNEKNNEIKDQHNTSDFLISLSNTIEQFYNTDDANIKQYRKKGNLHLKKNREPKDTKHSKEHKKEETNK